MFQTASSSSTQNEKIQLLESELEVTRRQLGERDLTIQLLVRRISKDQGEDISQEVES